MPLVAWPKKLYNVIYADPPWDGLGWNNGSGKKAPANHYQVQTGEWIQKLPVRQIAAQDCALFLWVTFPNLQLGLDTISSWGFKYATCAFTWVKVNRGGGWFLGLGNYTRANAELCLLGTKGKTQAMRLAKDVPQILKYPNLGHSFKPPETRERITRLFGKPPRIELFARQKVDGWDCWGNEV